MFPKKIGFIGLGHIGLRAAELFLAFGAKVIAFNRSVNPKAVEMGIEYKTLDEVLQESDIITEFDGISVTSMSDLRELLLYYAAGETVEMTVQSNENGAYTEKTVEITLGSREDSQY